jgi:holo-[acyl-carrier protein] synthase
MIHGIGTDIVEIKRIAKMKSFDAFANKILSENELSIFHETKDAKKASFLAKQFASKEAIAKAFGTGFKNSIQMNNIEVLRDEVGKPIFNPLGDIKKTLINLGITKTHVSLADESEHAIAFAILEI